MAKNYVVVNGENKDNITVLGTPINRITVNDELVYEKIPTLLDGSNEHTDVTGGWNGSLYTGASGTQNLYNDGQGLYGAVAGWNKSGTALPINVTDYSKLVIEVNFLNGQYVESMNFGLLQSLSSPMFSGQVKAFTESVVTNLATRKKTYTLDISSISGSYYVYFAVTCGTRYPVRLEKVTLTK